MSNKTKAILEIEKTLVFMDEDNSEVKAVLSEGTEAYMQFSVKGNAEWLLCEIIQLAPRVMYVRDTATQKVRRFSYNQLTGVSDKCPM